MIKRLLYEERYSVEGAKKRIKELRKEGDLKGFKEEVVGAVAPPAPAEAEPDHQQEILAVVEEIKELGGMNVSDLFHY